MIRKILASNFGLKVSDDSGATFVTVSGMMNIGLSIETEEIDTTDYDNEGWKTFIPGTRGLTIEAEGFRLTDPETGARDAGQKMIEKAVRSTTDNLLTYQYYFKPQPTQYIQFEGYGFNGVFGGGVDDADPWSVTIKPASAPTIVGLAFGEDA